MSIFKDIGGAALSVVKAVAPTIASALPGPLGGVAKNALAAALGTGTDTEEIEAALVAASPQVLLKLREADTAFQLSMERIAADDRASARERHVALKDRTPPLLAGGVLVVFGALIATLVFRELPVANREILMILVGGVAGQATQVVNYYFGSSTGSKRKTELLKD